MKCTLFLQHIRLTSQWVIWRLKSPISRMFTQRFIHMQIQKISKLRVTGLCAGNSPLTGEFPHKRPVTRKMFSFDGVIMHLTYIWYSHNRAFQNVLNGSETLLKLCQIVLIKIDLQRVVLHRWLMLRENQQLCQAQPARDILSNCVNQNDIGQTIESRLCFIFKGYIKLHGISYCTLTKRFIFCDIIGQSYCYFVTQVPQEWYPTC